METIIYKVIKTVVVVSSLAYLFVQNFENKYEINTLKKEVEAVKVENTKLLNEIDRVEKKQKINQYLTNYKDNLKKKIQDFENSVGREQERKDNIQVIKFYKECKKNKECLFEKLSKNCLETKQDLCNVKNSIKIKTVTKEENENEWRNWKTKIRNWEIEIRK